MDFFSTFHRDEAKTAKVFPTLILIVSRETFLLLNFCRLWYLEMVTNLAY